MSMRVFVTGGAGYIGSHVVRRLLHAGHDVLVYDNLSSGHREALPQAPLVVGDITDTAHLRQTLIDYHPDAVMHFAGLISVSESTSEPDRYYRVNTLAGLSLLSLMHELGIMRIVFSSTAAVYGVPLQVPIPESHPTAPINPYGCSKLAFEFMLSSFSRAYGLGFVSLRYFNAAGADPSGDIGEDHPVESHLVPLVLRTALNDGPPLCVYGDDYDTPDGTCIRDYIHVTDLADAHVLALPAIVKGQGAFYNVGTGSGHSVRQVISAAEAVIGRPVPFTVAPRRPGDPPVLVASGDRIARDLGWKPKLSSLQDILRSAWKWHQSHPHGFRKS